MAIPLGVLKKEKLMFDALPSVCIAKVILSFFDVILLPIGNCSIVPFFKKIILSGAMMSTERSEKR